MFRSRGTLEILQSAEGAGPKSFNDFTKISIDKRRLSSATVSKRLNELLAVGALKEVITRSEAGRRIISYQTTEKGKKVVALAKELEKVFDNLKAK